ncbi:MAG TPA: pyrroline-5-carboxylate reductase [Candidatus Mailhella merdavium]|nr:pyrroline-5-carboxylate reductase [Candidatus Mailhella merdavium]
MTASSHEMGEKSLSSGPSIGCIGCGNMGGAVLRGLCAHASLKLFGHDHTRAKVESLNPADAPGRIAWVDTPEELARMSDIVILAVKPYQMADMLKQIQPCLGTDKIVVSLAAAVSLDELKQGVQGICPVSRLMPNLPARVGKGVFALCLDDEKLKDAQKVLLQELFRVMGLVLILPDGKFSAFSSVAGCGPAFVCLFMEGMENAAVSLGFRADQARELVAATVEGTAALALQGGLGFADLRRQVCSPGGTTIYGVNHMERTAVRGHVTDGVLAAMRRDEELSGK